MTPKRDLIRRALPYLGGCLLVGAVVVILTPDAVGGATRSVRATATIVAMGVGAVALGVIVRRLSGKQWAAITASLLPPALVLGLTVLPFLHQRTLNEELTISDLTALEAPAASHPAPVATPIRLVSGNLNGIGHDASGTVTVYRVGASKFVLRFEDVNIERVPDARVYIEPGSGVERPTERGVNLGPTKAEKGSFSLAIPDGFIVPSNATVLIWCQPFKTPVASATLQ